MKKLPIIAALIAATYLPILAEKSDYYHASGSESSSSESSFSSDKGGQVVIGGETYHLEPGQSLQVSGGGETTHIDTTQEGAAEPVTKIITEKHPMHVEIVNREQTEEDEDAFLKALLEELHEEEEHEL